MNAVGFVRALFGDRFDNLLLWKLPDKSSVFLDSSKSWEADLNREIAAARKQNKDLFFGVSLRRSKVEHGRGDKRTCSQIGGLWADVDFSEARGPKSRKGYPTRDTVMAWLEGQREELGGLQPSFVVLTGGGCHLWWLLDRPWLLPDDASRDAAEDLVFRLQNWIRANLGEIDSTHDVSRVLRLPFTWSSKRHCETSCLFSSAGEGMRRYGLDVLSEFLRGGDRKTSVRRQRERGASRGGGGCSELPPEVISRGISIDRLSVAIENSPAFAAVWRRARDLPSQSEYDQSIASHLVDMGFTDTEISQAIWSHRKLHGEDLEKVTSRSDYLRRTLFRARSGHSRDVAELLEDDQATDRTNGAVSDPAVAGDGDEKSSDFIKKKLTRIFGTPPIERILKTGTDDPVYEIQCEGGYCVSLGTCKEWMRGSGLEHAICIATDVYPDLPVKRVARVRFINQMLRICEQKEIDTSVAGLCRAAIEDLRSQAEANYLPMSTCIEQGQPYIHDGDFYFRHSALVRALGNRYNCNPGRSELARAVEEVGATQARPYYTRENQRVSRRYYKLAGTQRLERTT